MSFCLSTLPYGLKRCLQELAKPYEVLQLQDASGTCMPGFCPRPFRRRFHREAKLTIERKNDALKMVAVGGYTKSEHYVVCERELTLHKLTADHFSSEEINWSKLVLRPKIVTISYCDLSPQFMAKLASMDLGTKKELTIHNCTGLVDFEALFKAFPNVEELKVIGGFAKTWTTDILKHQKSPLKLLELEGNFKDGDKLFDFKDFEKLLSAQPPRFNMTLHLLDDPTRPIQEMLLRGDCPELKCQKTSGNSLFILLTY